MSVTDASLAQQAKLRELARKVFGAEPNTLLSALRWLLGDGAESIERKVVLRRWLDSHAEWFDGQGAATAIEQMDDDDYPEAVMQLCRSAWSFAMATDAPAAALIAVEARETKIIELAEHALNEALRAYGVLNLEGLLPLELFDARKQLLERDVQRLRSPRSTDDNEGKRRGRPPSPSTLLGQWMMEILLSAGFGRAADNKLGVNVAIEHAQTLVQLFYLEPTRVRPPRPIQLSTASLQKIATSVLGSFPK